MRYEKPRIMDLNARSVAGQADPNLCWPGSQASTGGSPGTFTEDCFAGTGGAGGDPGMCTSGHSPVGGYECYAGGTPTQNGYGQGMCNAGGAPSATDSGGCRVGPSNALVNP